MSERGKGYGNKILSLLLDECKKIGIMKVQIGANLNNIASNKIIVKNDGILFKTSESKNFYYVEL